MKPSNPEEQVNEVKVTNNPERLETKNGPLLFSFFLLTALFYSLLVLLRHYSFETHGHDLGIFDQGAWHWSQGLAPFSSLKGYNLLGDHFTPILAWAAPFYWLWNGPETLLVLQTLTLLSGLFPAYALARQHLKSGWLQVYPPLFYALFFGVGAALDFDFHTDSLAAALFLWAVWAFERDYTRRYLVFLGLALLCKETVPVYLSFWAVYVLTTGRQRRLHAGLAVGGLILFLLELNLVIPFFAGRPYYYTDYGELGQSMSEAVLNSLWHPDRLFRALFGQAIKVQTWLVYFVSCGGAILLRPAFLLLLIPNVIERFLNPQSPRWTLYFHYSVILAPFFTYAVVLALVQCEKWLQPRPNHTPNRAPGRAKFVDGWIKSAWKGGVLGLWLGLVLGLNAFVYGQFFLNGVKNWQALNQDRTAIWQALGQIPPGAAVTASSRLVPHLAHREKIDELLSPEPSHPELKAEYIVISLEIERDETERARLQGEVARFLARPDYGLLYQRGQTWLFRLAPPPTS